jgi:hypothetical protein
VCRYSRQVRLFLQQVKRYKTAGHLPLFAAAGPIFLRQVCFFHF